MPRFRLRTLLIFITVVAISLWQWQRASALLRQAAIQDGKATDYVNASYMTSAYEGRSRGKYRVPRKDETQFNDRARFHGELAEQYRRAAWLPWVTSLREPPAPEAPPLRSP